MAEEPGQEQRAFWAILLAMGVLLAWSMIFPMGPRGRDEGTVTPAETTAPGPMTTLRGAPTDSVASPAIARADTDTAVPQAPDTGAARTPAASTEPGEADGSLLGVLKGSGPILRRAEEGAEGVPVTVRVDGHDLSLEIDGRGARLTEATLHGFTESDGGPVQLLPPDGAGALGTVVVVGEHEVSLDAFAFRLVSDSVTREGRRIVWELPLEELTLRKTFVVPDSGNTLVVRQELVDDRVGLTGWGLAWAGGVRKTESGKARRGPYFQGSVLAEGKVQKKNPGNLKDGPIVFPGHTYFVGIHNKYFLGAIIPQGEDQGPAKLWRAASGRDEEPSVGGEILVERTPGLAANDVAYDVYIGPQDYEKLQGLGLGIEGTVDLGWSWVRPLSTVILKLLIGVHKVIPNYGVVIILFSLAINLLFFPLTFKSTKSMRDMAALKPRLDALKEKYKDEPQKMSEATMRLYKEAGVNPLAGCLPMLLQMPVFFALYAVLFHTIELRQAPFFGWIHDLSQPDVLFHLPVALPFIGTGISLLPIIMGITSFFQSKATMVDPNQKAMVYMMPVMMTFIFFTMPSGLVLYWLVSNLFTIGQKALMKPSSAAQATAGG
jgi:YidC/Oxa1 family membrane protein insertase